MTMTQRLMLQRLSNPPPLDPQVLAPAWRRLQRKPLIIAPERMAAIERFLEREHGLVVTPAEFALQITGPGPLLLPLAPLIAVTDPRLQIRQGQLAWASSDLQGVYAPLDVRLTLGFEPALLPIGIGLAIAHLAVAWESDATIAGRHAGACAPLIEQFVSLHQPRSFGRLS